MTQHTQPVAVRLPDPAPQPGLADEVSALVNQVYRAAEAGLWRPGFARTTPQEVAALIAVGELAIVEHGGRVLGCIHLHDIAPDTALFGMLAAAPDQRGKGIGRALVDFAEDRARLRGVPTMRLELLVPREREHPAKELLKAWYARRGYRRVRTTSLDDEHAHLTPLLATPCDLEIYEKALLPSSSSAVTRRQVGPHDAE